MDVIQLRLFGVVLLLLFVYANAQFYGSYGRNSYLAPITFPEATNRATTVPVLSRVGADFPSDIQATSAQISRGSEQFSFEMYYVSSSRAIQFEFIF